MVQDTARRSIFVTGGASGIGRATVELFHREGWRVAAADRDGSALATLSSNDDACLETFTVDVTDHNALVAALETFTGGGALDLMFNNAGIGHSGWFEDIDPAVERRLGGTARRRHRLPRIGDGASPWSASARQRPLSLTLQIQPLRLHFQPASPQALTGACRSKEQTPMNQPITVEIAPGELLDKLTILEIKRERIEDSQKLINVGLELEVLDQARRQNVPDSPELDALYADLKTINETLWEIEDDIRDCERDKDFGERFIELARAVYKTNDRRAATKRAINELLGSRIVEEKSYAEYE